MPYYPQLKEHKAGEPLDLSNIDYPIQERFTSAFNNAYEHNMFNLIVNNRPHAVNPDPKYPGTMPITEDDVTQWKIDRPGLPNIPIGYPKYLGLAAVSLYDNDKSVEVMKETEPSIMGKGAFWAGGTIGGALSNIKALIAAVATGGVGGRVASTIAESGLAKMGASELFGSKAVNIATQLGQGAGEWGAANMAFQATTEIQEAGAHHEMLQPYNYIRGLQNVLQSGAEGALLGPLAKVLGIAVLGRKVMRFEDGSYIEMNPREDAGVYHEPDFTVSPEGNIKPQEGKTAEGKPWKAERVGGLFGRPEFADVPPKVKQAVADNFKPWTATADNVMTEEAAGQMMNGQVPDVSTIMKQGIADAGAEFRQALRDGNVDINALDEVLSNAHENIKSEVADLLKSIDEVKESTKLIKKMEDLPIREDSDLSQAGILKRAQLAQFEESIMKQSPELVPENVRKYIETQKEIDRLNAKIEADKAKQLESQPEKTAADIEPNKKVVKRIESLEKRKPKILSPKKELGTLKQKILKQIGAPDYGQGEAYQRLSELSNVWKAAKALKDNLDSLHDLDNKLTEVSGHDFITGLMRDHINDSHEGATHQDVIDYANRLNTNGIPHEAIPDEFAPKPEMDVDAYLAEYPPEEIKSITEKLNDEAFNKEIEKAASRVKNIPTMKEMVKSMTDCLMKESI